MRVYLTQKNQIKGLQIRIRSLREAVDWLVSVVLQLAQIGGGACYGDGQAFPDLFC